MAAAQDVVKSLTTAKSLKCAHRKFSAHNLEQILHTNHPRARRRSTAAALQQLHHR